MAYRSRRGCTWALSIREDVKDAELMRILEPRMGMTIQSQRLTDRLSALCSRARLVKPKDS